MPWPFTKIWQMSGTSPPVYLSVYCFCIQPCTTQRYPSCQEDERILPGLKMFVLCFILRLSFEITHFPSSKVSSCTLSTSELYKMAVVRGPQTASNAFACEFILSPINLFYPAGQIENILPTEKLVSMIELPSIGSQVTIYPQPSLMLLYYGLSQLANPLASLLAFKCFQTSSSVITSCFNCLSPNLLWVSNDTTVDSLSLSDIYLTASRRDLMTENYGLLKLYSDSIFTIPK